MTTIHIGRPPRRPVSPRRVLLAAAIAVPLLALATLVVAAAVRRMAGFAPLDVSDWLIAIVALVGLISSLATPGRRNTRRAPRPRTSGATDRRAHYPRLLRLVRARAGRPHVARPPRLT